MNSDEYQKLAERTDATKHLTLTKFIDRCCGVDYGDEDNTHTTLRLLHSVLGLMGELGELASHLERVLFYGTQDLDQVNIVEEYGDILWYVAQGANATRSSLGNIQQANLNKLRHRYPKKFDQELSKEDSRDRAGERKEVEQGVKFDPSNKADPKESDPLKGTMWRGAPPKDVWKIPRKGPKECPACGQPLCDETPFCCPNCGNYLRIPGQE